jgi:hypothetical protein
VLRARCAQAESGLAYAGLADLLGRVTDTVLAALPSPQRRPLEVVLGRAEVGQDPVEPHLVGRATLGVLQSLAAATPLLVALDDVQWLDPASARTLTFALRRLEAVPVGVLVTRREPGGPLPLGLDDALPQGRRDRLLVGPLDPDHLELLVEERLGDAGVREPTWARLVWSELDALVELGQLDRAAALAEELAARGRALDRPFALATAARARGLVLAARDDVDGRWPSWNAPWPSMTGSAGHSSGPAPCWRWGWCCAAASKSGPPDRPLRRRWRCSTGLVRACGRPRPPPSSPGLAAARPARGR